MTVITEVASGNIARNGAGSEALGGGAAEGRSAGGTGVAVNGDGITHTVSDGYICMAIVAEIASSNVDWAGAGSEALGGGAAEGRSAGGTGVAVN